MASLTDLQTEMETRMKEYPMRDEVNTLLTAALGRYTTSEQATALVVGARSECAESVVNSQKLMTNLMETRSKEAFEKLVTEKLDNMLKEIDDKVAIKIAELDKKIGEGKSKERKGKKERCLTTKRNIGFLPKYSGKHEEYDDWKFKVRTFLSEEVEFKELMIIPETKNEMPDEDRMKEILLEAIAESKVNGDPERL